MPWVGNQYIFPRAAPAYATWPSPPAPPPPPPPPVIPQRWILPEQIDGGDAATDPSGQSYAGPSTSPSFSNPFGSYSQAENYGRAASLLGLATGVPAIGLLGVGLGAYSDVAKAEAELAGRFPGYPAELNTFEAFKAAATPFGWGKSAAEQMAAEMNALQDFYSDEQTSVPAIQAALEAAQDAAEAEAAGFAAMAAAEAQEADETAPGVAGWGGFGGYGGYGGYGGPGSSDIGGETGGAGDAGGPGGKIACTMMNRLYGFGSFRNAVWMRYARDHMPEPEWELGYHKVCLLYTSPSPRD